MVLSIRRIVEILAVAFCLAFIGLWLYIFADYGLRDSDVKGLDPLMGDFSPPMGDSEPGGP